MTTTSFDSLIFHLTAIRNEWPIVDSIDVYSDSQKQVSHMINVCKKYDDNKDGNLSFDEFKKLYKEHTNYFEPYINFINNIKQRTLGFKWWDLLIDRYKRYKYIYEYRQKNNDKPPSQSICKKISCYLITGYFSLYDCDYYDPPIDSDRFELLLLLQKNHHSKVRLSILNNQSEANFRMSAISRKSSNKYRKSTGITFNSSNNNERSRLYNMEKSKRASEVSRSSHCRRYEDNTEKRSVPIVRNMSIDEKIKKSRQHSTNIPMSSPIMLKTPDVTKRNALSHKISEQKIVKHSKVSPI